MFGTGKGNDTDDSTTHLDDDAALARLGYKPTFKREFTNISTISFAFSIMGMCSSIATTFDTPMLYGGGPASAVWCWILGACMCLTLGASIAELVSAYPTAGGLYTASASLVPRRYRAVVGFSVGWLNLLGQIAGVSSTEFGLARMIMAAAVIGTDGAFVVTQGKIVGLMFGLLAVHGLLNSVPTKWLARVTSSFVFVNVGATLLIIIVVLACTPRSEMHAANYVFGGDGIVNQAGNWPTGIAFLFGLLSVQWTMTDYDATAHISEEVQRAAVAGPSAIFVAVIGTGLIGWLLNIVMVLCSGPLADLPGPSGLSFLQIMYMRLGKGGCLTLWVFVCFTAFAVVQTAIQACARTLYAISRDHGLPDRGLFGVVSKRTQTPIYAVWAITFVCVLPGLLDLASPIAANAIFALTTVALDISYIVPIACRRIFRNHPDVDFKPGPFYMPGALGWIANIICISWTSFIAVILCFPTYLPTTAQTMNYAGVIFAGVLSLALTWYMLSAHKHYHGPQGNLMTRMGATEEEQQSESDETKTSRSPA
ncbi:hypothetical protein FRB95_006695 [Tulasnella sp. JGI-2019a]|nr:hypothetical protein FRB95_006695 [Tulasnella sp. JGI-2019a]